jgi:hypothetical protein
MSIDCGTNLINVFPKGLGLKIARSMACTGANLKQSSWKWIPAGQLSIIRDEGLKLSKPLIAE